MKALAAGLLCLLSLPVTAGEALPGPVVDVQWLQKNLADVEVIDVRNDLDDWSTAPTFEKDDKTGKPKLAATGGHLERALPLLFGATRVDRMVGNLKIQKMVPDKAAWQQLMQQTGVHQDRAIVITSPGESADEVEAAARVYWTLKLYGARAIALLDGGNAAWITAGLPVSTAAVTTPARGDWTAGDERRDLLAEADDVSAAASRKVQLVDARPLAQYLGLAVKKPTVLAAGHIDQARNYPTELRLRSAGIAQMFLSADEYRAAMAAQGIDTAAPTITYCNTGHMAAGMWFVQSEILGNPHVRLYDGSMHEWTTLGRPVVALIH